MTPDTHLIAQHVPDPARLVLRTVQLQLQLQAALLPVDLRQHLRVVVDLTHVQVLRQGRELRPSQRHARHVRLIGGTNGATAVGAAAVRQHRRIGHHGGAVAGRHRWRGRHGCG